MGAVGGLAADPGFGTEGVDWVFTNPTAMGNCGNGWQSFPDDAKNLGYNKEPEGVVTFPSGNQDFQMPATVPGGPLLG